MNAFLKEAQEFFNAMQDVVENDKPIFSSFAAGNLPDQQIQNLQLLAEYKDKPNEHITISLPLQMRNVWSRQMTGIKIDSKLLPIIFSSEGIPCWCYRHGRIITSAAKFKPYTFYHRFITRCPPEKEVEFLNKEHLDFTKTNLRIVDRVSRQIGLRKQNLAIYDDLLED